MKWIKASERLPELYEVVYLKESLNGHRRMGNFFKEEDGTINFGVMGNGVHEGFTIENKYFDVLEWLDESINQEGSLKDWKEKFLNWYYSSKKDGTDVIEYFEENVIAPLLQNKYKGDDLVASEKSKTEHNGETKTIAEWGRVTGLGKDTICDRIRNGWSISRTMNTPVKPIAKPMDLSKEITELLNQGFRVFEIASKLNRNYFTIYDQVKKIKHEPRRKQSQSAR